MERKNKYIIEREIEAVLDYKSGKRGTRRYVRTWVLINLIMKIIVIIKSFRNLKKFYCLKIHRI